MDRASRVGDINGDVTDLLQPVTAFVDPEKLRYRRRRLDAKLPRRYVGRERRSGFCIFEEWAV